MEIPRERWNEMVSQIEVDYPEKPMHSYPNWQMELEMQCFSENIIAAKKIQNELVLREQRADWSEAERERRKAEVEMVSLDEGGEVYVQTINTRRKYAPRYVANFCNPTISCIKNCETKEIAYILTLRVSGRIRKVIVEGSNAGNESYFLERLNSVGADFLCDRKEQRMRYTAQLWNMLLATVDEPIPVVPRKGWYIDERSQIKFEEEEDKTWDYLMQKKSL